MNPPLRALYFGLLVRPVAYLCLGLNIRRREKIPTTGPAIIVANHNSHLDTMVLMALVPWKQLPLVRPVAAADYFMKKKLLAWFAQEIIGIIPLRRDVKASGGKHPLDDCVQALERGEILILFPEGSRGEPEQLSRFKSGLAHLLARFPAAPVHPIYLHGLGKSLPKGEALLVPFICDAFVGEPIHWAGDRKAFLEELDERMAALGAEGHFAPWE